MTKEMKAGEEQKKRLIKRQEKATSEPGKEDGRTAGQVRGLQRRVGNQAVGRWIAQRSGGGAVQLDDETAGQIEQARGGGKPLENATRDRMSGAFGFDFSTVRAHTDREADSLNRRLGARAFTTGRDIFFRSGEYQPDSGAGQELIAHELTHVVQQSSGAVESGGGMRVTPPDHATEAEADAVAAQVTSGQEVARPDLEREKETSLQRELVQLQEEEEIMMQEEEELLMTQPVEEEEEELMMQPIEEEEEELMMQPLEEEEEMLQTKRGSGTR